MPQGCRVHVLAAPDGDLATALAMLAERVGASTAPVQHAAAPGLPTGTLTADAVCAALGALMPEGAIVSDEGNTSGLSAAGYSAGSPPHDWLCLTGGAIGDGLPVAVGAAVACPDRKVIALESDGSALYTMQSWWTMARENLDVTTILFNNRSYAILNMEMIHEARIIPIGGPATSSKIDMTMSCARPSRVVKFWNFPASKRLTPPPNVPIHRAPPRSWKREKIPLVGSPSFSV